MKLLGGAKCHALGGNHRLADAVVGTRLTENFENDDFWVSVFRFFVRNPLLDIAHFGPIVDCIWNKKYEPRRIFDERGVAETVGPEQPNFSMKGRNPEPMLNQMERWHRQLGKESKGGKLQWKHSDIGDFELQEGNSKTGNMKFWQIKELLSSGELVVEGRAMKNCVASYSQSCSRGKSSIWSMEVEDKNGRDKLLTIEINNRNNTICQVRGKNNRYATQNEMKIVQRWVANEGLNIASYVLAD